MWCAYLFQGFRTELSLKSKLLPSLTDVGKGNCVEIKYTYRILKWIDKKANFMTKLRVTAETCHVFGKTCDTMEYVKLIPSSSFWHSLRRTDWSNNNRFILWWEYVTYIPQQQTVAELMLKYHGVTLARQERGYCSYPDYDRRKHEHGWRFISPHGSENINSLYAASQCLARQYAPTCSRTTWLGEKFDWGYWAEGPFYMSF